MKFEFAKTTNVTTYAFTNNSEYENNGYVSVFITPDVNDVWLVRLRKEVRYGHGAIEGSYIVERDKISNDYKGQDMNVNRLKNIIVDDEFENWDYYVFDNYDEAIERIDGGYGFS